MTSAFPPGSCLELVVRVELPKLVGRTFTRGTFGTRGREGVHVLTASSSVVADAVNTIAGMVPRPTGQIRQSTAGRSVDTERLIWELPSSRGGGRLDLLPNALGPHVDVEITGRRLGTLPKPTPNDPWSEATFELSSGSITIVLIWHEPIVQTDVFVDRTSLRDGRSIDEVRSSAPAPVSGCELRFGTGFMLTRGPLMPPLVTISGLGSIAVWVVAIGLGLKGSEPGAVLTVSMVLFIVSYVWTWAAATTRVHRHNLAHRELGDARRTAMITATFLGFPVVTLGPVAAVLFASNR